MRTRLAICAVLFLTAPYLQASWLKPSPVYSAARKQADAERRAEIAAIADERIAARVPTAIDEYVRGQFDAVLPWARAMIEALVGLGVGGAAWKGAKWHGRRNGRKEQP